MSHSVRSTGLPNFDTMSLKRQRAAFIRFSQYDSRPTTSAE